MKKVKNKKTDGGNPSESSSADKNKKCSQTQPRRTSRAPFHISRALVATERFAS